MDERKGFGKIAHENEWHEERGGMYGERKLVVS